MSFLAGYDVSRPYKPPEKSGGELFVSAMESVGKLSLMRRQEERLAEASLMDLKEKQQKLDTLALRNDILSKTLGEDKEEQILPKESKLSTETPSTDSTSPDTTLQNYTPMDKTSSINKTSSISKQFSISSKLNKGGMALLKAGDYVGGLALANAANAAQQSEIEIIKVQGDLMNRLTNTIDDIVLNSVNPTTGKLDSKGLVNNWEQESQKLKQLFPEEWIDKIDPSKIKTYKGQIVTMPAPGSEDAKGNPQQFIVSQRGEKGVLIVDTLNLQKALKSMSAKSESSNDSQINKLVTERGDLVKTIGEIGRTQKQIALDNARLMEIDKELVKLRGWSVTEGTGTDGATGTTKTGKTLEGLKQKGSESQSRFEQRK